MPPLKRKNLQYPELRVIHQSRSGYSAACPGTRKKKGGSHSPNFKMTHPIKQRLTDLGRTQKSLALEIGCTTATLRNFMRGQTRLKPATLRRLLGALGVEENYLYNMSSRKHRT
ncbi:MAG TPA: helix-turn-helix transcriptional regulator [Chloroflexia bacterium]|nr:helix-turn-helix transcriptional regulator [Chloroflexia bacterium]